MSIQNSELKTQHSALSTESVRRRDLERANALIRIAEHLRAALGHLRAAAHEARAFGIAIERLPPERPLFDAIEDCARLYQSVKPGAESGEKGKV
jgi:hypothetical protein